MNVVVVLTALPLEYQAVRQHLKNPQGWPHPAGTLFEVGHLPGGTGMIALAQTGEGNVSAAVLAERAIAAFQPRALLCAGIAGGLKDDIALGDIVVATKIYALHSGREHDDGFLPRPKSWFASHQLQQLAHHEARTGAWTRLIPEYPSDPDGPAPEAVRPAVVHFKPVVSGEVVLTATDTSLTALLRRTYDDAVAVEMESAGTAQAAHLNRSLPTLSVRGIGDHADARKHIADRARWQHIAAQRAAAFAVSTATTVMRQRARMVFPPSLQTSESLLTPDPPLADKTIRWSASA